MLHSFAFPSQNLCQSKDVILRDVSEESAMLPIVKQARFTVILYIDFIHTQVYSV